MSWLLLDVGNTRIKWALVAEQASLGQWLAAGALAYAELDAAIAALNADLAAASQPDAHASAAARSSGISKCLLSNVGGPAVQEALLTLLLDKLHAPTPEIFSSSATRAGLSNRYRNPRQLGSDRFASAIGARALYPGEDLVVATCGTATTIDAITGDGVFIGGMILPGLGLMAQALASRTAQLPAVAAAMKPGLAFADNTEEAIALGCLTAQASAIDRARSRLPGARCIISGGAAQMVEPFLQEPACRVENLVLLGLQAAAMEKS